MTTTRPQPTFHDFLRLLADAMLAAHANPRPPEPRTLTAPSIFFREMDGAVRQLLRDFYPEYSDNEKPYHDQAEAFFRSRCPGATIQRTPKHNGGRPDLVITMPGLIGGSLIVEIKVRLSSRSARDRLVGQVHDYHRGGHQVLVLLCGNVSPAHVQDVTNRVAAVAPSALGEGSILVVDRTVRALAQSRRQEASHAESNRQAMALIRQLRDEDRREEAARAASATSIPPDPAHQTPRQGPQDRN